MGLLNLQGMMSLSIVESNRVMQQPVPRQSVTLKSRAGFWTIATMSTQDFQWYPGRHLLVLA
jgi:hypothetical protein